MTVRTRCSSVAQQWPRAFCGFLPARPILFGCFAAFNRGSSRWHSSGLSLACRRGVSGTADSPRYCAAFFIIAMESLRVRATRIALELLFMTGTEAENRAQNSSQEMQFSRSVFAGEKRGTPGGPYTGAVILFLNSGGGNVWSQFLSLLRKKRIQCQFAWPS